MPIQFSAVLSAMQEALNLAETFVGATAPNPPVGAAALDSNGKILSVQAHQRVGTPHAEALVFADLMTHGLFDEAVELIVTLEPCNHTGRTPPCVEGILRSKVKRVIIGSPDPNPRVAGGGAEALKRAGLEVKFLSEFERDSRNPTFSRDSLLTSLAGCQKLIAPFTKLVTQGLPWVVIKTALDHQGSMIPPTGQKTFTQNGSLLLAHKLRKRSDALLTGSGTILADAPEFTVRHVPDHPERTRWLVVLDRRGRVSASWKNRAKLLGFQVILLGSLEEGFAFLGRQGVLQVLVEAGPELSRSVLESSFWDEHVLIKQTLEFGKLRDTVEYVYRNH